MANTTEAGDRWERSPGFIYFIAAGDPPRAIKIGISTQRDLRRRLSTLQCGNHEPLVILRVIPIEGSERPMLDAEQREMEIHAQFAHLQLFEKGWAGSEWFTVAPELLEFIKGQGISPEERSLPSSVARPGPGRS